MVQASTGAFIKSQAQGNLMTSCEDVFVLLVCINHVVESFSDKKVSIGSSRRSCPPAENIYETPVLVRWFCIILIFLSSVLKY